MDRRMGWLRGVSALGGVIYLVLGASLASAVQTWTEHEGKFYVFSGLDLEFDLSISHPCATPGCRVLELPGGATVGNDPNLKLYWAVPADERGEHIARHQFCELLNAEGTACSVWGPVLTTTFVALPYFEVAAMEISQSVQNLHNQMPLVPHKETYLRAYVQLNALGVVPAHFESVTAKLHAFDIATDQELPGSPISPLNELGLVFPVQTDVTDPEAAGKREDWDATLNFRLDRSWLSGSVRLEIAAVDDVPIFDCEPGLNPPRPYLSCQVGAIFWPQLELHPSGVPATWPEVKFVGFRWRDHRNVVHDPMPGGDVTAPGEISDQLVSMLPIDGITWDAYRAFWSVEEVPHKIAAYPSKSEVEVFYAQMLLRLLRIAFADYRANDEGTVPFYYGLLTGPVGYYRATNGTLRRMNGVSSSIPGVAAIGIAEKPKTAAHEFMHLLGFEHAVEDVTLPNGQMKGPCGERARAGTEPFDHLYLFGDEVLPTITRMEPLQDWRDYGFGLDSRPRDGTEEPVVLSPYDSFSIRSYCGGKARWIADTTYAELVEAIWDGNGLLDDHSGQILPGFEQQLLILGVLRLQQLESTLAPLFEIGTDIVPPAMPPGAYSVQLLDGVGGLLQEISFDPVGLELDVDEGETVEPSDVALFYVVADANPLIEQVVVRNGSTVLQTLQASTSPPTIAVVSPNGGEVLSGSETIVTWTGDDLDGDPLTYMLEYSPDAGAHWTAIAAGLTQSEYTVRTELLAQTATGLMRVTASDGFRSASDDSDATFTVPNHPPRVLVGSPPLDDNELFIGSQTISLRATAHDREDGPVSDANIEWSSDVDGVLGHGRAVAVPASLLSEGQHEITVSATDSGALAGTAVTRVRVLQVAPPALTDLGLEISGPEQLVPTGQSFSLLATAHNAGPDPATGVEVVVAVPAAVIVESATPSTGSCTTPPGEVRCSVASLDPDAGVSVTIAAHSDVEGDFGHGATVSGSETDPGLADNGASTVVPEPSFVLLIAAGAALLALLAGRRRPRGSARASRPLR